jgi:hypothetical protein
MYNNIGICRFQKSVANCGRITRVANFHGFLLYLYSEVYFCLCKMYIFIYQARFPYRIDSCPCKACLRQMALQLQPPGEENSWRRNRLKNELKSKLSVL